MTSSVTNPVKPFIFIALGLSIAAMGFYVANADDAPGAAAMGLLVMLAAVLLGVKAARNRLPIWAGRAALAVGLLIAAFAASLTYAVTVAEPLFAQSTDVPSVSEPAPRATMGWKSVDRARSAGARGDRGAEPAGSLDRGRHRRGCYLG